MGDTSVFRELPELIRSMDDDLRLSPSDIAAVLSKSPETVRRWIRTGRLRSISPNRYVIEGKDLKLFLLATLRYSREYPSTCYRHFLNI